MEKSDPDLAKALKSLSESDRQALMDFLGSEESTALNKNHLVDSLRASISLHHQVRSEKPN